MDYIVRVTVVTESTPVCPHCKQALNQRRECRVADQTKRNHGNGSAIYALLFCSHCQRYFGTPDDLLKLNKIQTTRHAELPSIGKSPTSELTPRERMERGHKSSLFDKKTCIEDTLPRDNCISNKESVNAFTIIQNYFELNYRISGKPYKLDNEQANAIASNAKNTLVSARAGSGKTRVIVGKIAYLIEKENVPPESILVLAFNKKVPQEILERLKQIKKANGDELFSTNIDSIPKTFHKLAYSFADQHSGVLTDGAQTHFVKLIIQDLANSDDAFKSRVYRHFRQDNSKSTDMCFRSNIDYYNYIKNHRYQTLNGEIVKSYGEHWISDYLFEHGIKHIYEKKFSLYKINSTTLTGTESEVEQLSKELDKYDYLKLHASTKPDFFLNDYNLVWEHWGIDEHETNSQIKKEFEYCFGMPWQKYWESMLWKRNFWTGSWRNHLVYGIDNDLDEIYAVNGLIETSIVDMKNGTDFQERRENFENLIAAILIENGIQAKKLEKDDLIERVWEKKIDHFTELMVSFIRKYELKYMNDRQKFEKETKRYEETSRERDFLELGMMVYNRYLEVLTSPNKPANFETYQDNNIDFNLLLSSAQKNIEMGSFDSEIQKIQYIMIDEYQDFSELFFRFINAIISRNNRIKLLCVGDTWQAINRFMGADTCYFDEFCDYFGEESKKLCITTNYRSEKCVVVDSNNFMSKNGYEKDVQAICKKSDLQNNCDKGQEGEEITDIKTVDMANYDEVSSYSADKIYIEKATFSYKYEKHRNYILAKYLKKCVSIITHHRNETILILHRKNKLNCQPGLLLSDFKSRLDTCLKELGILETQRKLVSVETIHKAKGLEADIVIILEANRENFPLLHPDAELFRVFGETPENIVEDEKKLFYVAITRAKRKVYFLWDTEKTYFLDCYKGQNIGLELIDKEHKHSLYSI